MFSNQGDDQAVTDLTLDINWFLQAFALFSAPLLKSAEEHLALSILSTRRHCSQFYYKGHMPRKRCVGHDYCSAFGTGEYESKAIMEKKSQGDVPYHVLDRGKH